MNYLSAFVIFLLTIFTAFGDSFLKRASQSKVANISYLLIGLSVYVLTGFIWFFIYKQTKFSLVGSVYGVSTALVFAIVGIFYFKETMHPSEALGLLLALSSIVLLGRFGS
jgi:drug/metabolite transporter (DMT)-like permease